MIKLELIEPFMVTKTRPPIIMPEDAKNRKKYQAYSIMAPDIASGFDYITKSGLTFRNLYRYFIPKKYTVELYRAGKPIIQLNQDGEISRLFELHKTEPNFKNINGITSYLTTSKPQVLKEQNVLSEINYMSQYILHNDKDNRAAAFKAKDYMKALKDHYKTILAKDNYLGAYNHHLIVPMDAWFSDYNTPASFTKRVSTDLSVRVLHQLLHPSTLKILPKIYLVSHDVVLYIDYNKIPDTVKTSDDAIFDFMMDLVVQFVNKVRSSKRGEKETVVDAKIVVAEKETAKEVATDAVLVKAKVDPDKVPPATKKKIADKIEKSVDLDKLELDITDLEALKMDDIVTERDAILDAKMSGQSVQSYKRNEILKEKYKDLKMADEVLTDVLKAEEKYDLEPTPILANTMNENFKTLQANEMDKAYNENLFQHDIANILMHFSTVQPAMYLNKDIVVEDVSTPTDRLLKYTVEFESEDRKRHRFSFLLPKMYQDKYMYLNDQKMNLLHQKLPFPVTKIGPDKCQAVTNYKKIISERYGANLSPLVTKLKKYLTGPSCPRSIKVVTGSTNEINKVYLTTMEYDEIGSAIVRIDLGDNKDLVRIFLSVTDAMAQVPMSMAPNISEDETPENMLPLGFLRTDKTVKANYYLSGKTNLVYDDSGKSYGELSDFILESVTKYNPNIKSEFDSVSAGTKFMYSRSTVLAEHMPMIVMLMCADPGGLTAVLEKSGIKYEFVTTRPGKEYDKTKTGIVPFSDGWLVFDRYPYENSLLLNGLASFPTREFSYYDLNTRDTQVELLDLMFSKRHIKGGLENFYYMFIDPITMDILEHLNMPTEFTRLLLYCNGVLADNTYQLDSDYNNSRIRSNEIINAYLYTYLSEAWGTYRSGRAEKFSIPEGAIIKELMTSNIVDPHSELNLILEAENDRQVKLKGPSGMNEDHSFTIEKRAYHKSMTGIIAMTSVSSGEVGICRHLTVNPNIVNTRGFLSVGDDEYNGTQLSSPAELMNAFGPESADIERVAMSMSQSKHVIPVEDQSSCPVSYDMERIIPYMSNDYARISKGDGQVVEITEDIMVIKYSDGTFDDVDLSSRPAKNTDGGFYVMNQFKSDLKVGSKVKKGQILAYDPKYIIDTDMFGDPLAALGTMARVAVVTDGGVYEDACYITDDLAHRMAARLTKQKRVILSRFANISYMAKIGDNVKTNDPLLVFDDTADEFSSLLLAQMAEEANDDDEIIATSAPVLSKISGVIKDIRIYYTTPVEQMTPTMKKIVEDYGKGNRKREKVLDKYNGKYNSNTMVKPSDQLIPDSTGKVKGVKLEDGMFIDFYIEYYDIAAPGDKLTFWNGMERNLFNCGEAIRQ